MKNNDLNEKYREQYILQQALNDYKEQTGIDYMKWLMGDKKCV